MEYRGEDVVIEANCILPVNETRSGSVASALSQVVCLPLDMDEWKKATDDGLINNLRRGLLMVSKIMNTTFIPCKFLFIFG